ncbi:MAG: hypothetical protein DVB29_05440 [Verrucomicrobia bacterium]|nr:MAG: hypothetical protein DVB29_05440 [Verrucomicrobiota bacterium]
MKKKPRIILIIGMPHSGINLLSRGLETMGGFLSHIIDTNVDEESAMLDGTSQSPVFLQDSISRYLRDPNKILTQYPTGYSAFRGDRHEISELDLAQITLHYFPPKKNRNDSVFHSLNWEMLHFFQERHRCIISITKKEIALLKNEGFFTRATQLLLEQMAHKSPPARIFHADHDEEAAKADELRYVMKSDDGCMSPYGPSKNVSLTQEPSDFPASVVDEDAISELVLHDPLFTLLLPFWKQVFQKCHLEVSIVIAFRNPWSVAASKKEYLEKSFWVWISYILCCLEHSNGYQRVFVDYDELIENPMHQMTRVAHTLDLTLEQKSLASYCEYIDPSRRHYHQALEELKSEGFYQQFTLEIYTKLLEVTQDKKPFESLKKSFIKWKKAFLEANDLLVLAEKKDATINQLQEKITNLDESIYQIQKTINQNSHSITHYKKETDQRESQIAALIQAQSALDKELFQLRQTSEIQNCLIAA